MLRSGTIVLQDDYSYTSDRPWINHEWLCGAGLRRSLPGWWTARSGRTQGSAGAAHSRDRSFSSAAGRARSACWLVAAADGRPGDTSRPWLSSSADLHVREFSPGDHHPASSFAWPVCLALVPGADLRMRDQPPRRRTCGPGCRHGVVSRRARHSARAMGFRRCSPSRSGQQDHGSDRRRLPGPLVQPPRHRAAPLPLEHGHRPAPGDLRMGAALARQPAGSRLPGSAVGVDLGLGRQPAAASWASAC